jgi:hypothetical protein
MSLNNFVPEIWAAKIMMELQTNLVAAQSYITNRDYEGEIKSKGDRVYALTGGRSRLKHTLPTRTSPDPKTPPTIRFR